MMQALVKPNKPITVKQTNQMDVISIETGKLFKIFTQCIG